MDSPFRFCPGCGARGMDFSLGRVLRCQGCGYLFYLNAATACAAIIECGGRILCTRRARDPAKGSLGLPGGFVDPGERAEEGLLRELREETGIEAREEELGFLWSYANEYSYSGILYRTCDLFFSLRRGEEPGLRAGDDAAELEWLPRSALRPADFAFPSMRQALDRYLAAGGPARKERPKTLVTVPCSPSQNGQ